MPLFGDVPLCYCLAVFLCATVWRCFSVPLFGGVSLCYCLAVFLCGTIPANPTGFSGKIPENSHPSRYTGEFINLPDFQKIECTATSRDRTRAEYSKPRADSVLRYEYLPAFYSKSASIWLHVD